MINDDDKTETPGLNNDNEGATDTYNLNNQGVQGSGSINNISGNDPMLGVVLNGYTIESVLEKETGEAVIYLAAKGSEKVVVKHYKTERKPNQKVIKQIMNLDHPDIIKLYQDGTYNQRYYEIMEYAPGGTLADKNSDGRYKHIPMTEDKVVTVVKELVNAFKYFHDKGVIHRDIKPANLFCRKADGTDFLVGDFGISTDFDVDAGVLFKKTETDYKTPAYAAPEQFLSARDKDGKRKTGITLKADYYALGVTVYELLTGINMIEKRDVIYFATNVPTGVIVKDMLSMPEAANFSPRITKLIQGLMTVDPDKRWGYEQVTDWLNGKDVPVYLEFGKPVIPTLKFGDKTIKSVEELIAAIDADRENGKDYLGRGFLENWAKKFDESLANLIMDVNEENMDKDSKVAALLFRLDVNRPCKINGHIITKLDDIYELIRNMPVFMAEIILDKQPSDFYPWIASRSTEMYKEFIRMSDEYQRMGYKSAEEKIRIMNSSYLLYARNSIKPFPNDQFEIKNINGIKNLSSSYQHRAVEELKRDNSILYLWIISQASSEFGETWKSMDKNWQNLMDILDGKIVKYNGKFMTGEEADELKEEEEEKKRKAEKERQRKAEEARKQKEKELKRKKIIGWWSSILIILSFILSAGAVVTAFVILFKITSVSYELPGFSPLAYPPVTKNGAVIYQSDNAASKRIYAKGNLVVFEPVISKSGFESYKEEDLIPVKYFTSGNQFSGFMKKRDLDVSFRSGKVLLFFIPMIGLNIIFVIGTIILLIRDDEECFWFLITTGAIGTMGLVIIPSILMFISWKMDSGDSE